MTTHTVLPQRDSLGIRPGRLYIDGIWTDSAGDGVWRHVHPSTNEEVTTIVDASAEDVDRAVAAARRAFDEGPWPRMRAKERKAVIRRIVDLLREHAPRLSRIQTLENGTPLSFTSSYRVSAEAAADIFDYHAGWIDKLSGETAPLYSEATDLQCFSFREPVGVVAAIVAWNGPVLQTANKLAPALAAGCTVVLKPSEYASLSSLAIAELLDEAGLPPGVFNILTGVGANSGDALVQHPGVDKVSFTGSRPVGSRIIEASARDIRRVTLELGGKSPGVVFPDADVTAAAKAIMSNIAFALTGQQCTAQTRALVHEDCYDEFVAAAVEVTRSVRYGDPFDMATTSGAMVNTRQVDRVMGYIQGALDEGATLVAGGDRPGGDLAAGNFVNPTIFTGVDNHSTLAREEVFGPVLAVMPFKDEDDAVRIANDTEYGLAAGLYTKDTGRVFRVGRRLRAGVVAVNGYSFLTNAPVGGFKASGLGREGSRAALEAYTELKTVMVDVGTA